MLSVLSMILWVWFGCLALQCAVGSFDNRLRPFQALRPSDRFLSADSSIIDAAASREFDPYADNGGNIVAIAGESFVTIACDVRLSEGYSILSRNCSRIFNLDEDDRQITSDVREVGLLFGGCGCFADILELSKLLKYEASLYARFNKRKLMVHPMAYLLSNILYSRRLFPFYSFSCLAGLDENGFGALYEYDAVGSFQRCRTVCHGSAQKLLRPFLDEIDSACNTSLWKLNSSKRHSFGP